MNEIFQQNAKIVYHFLYSIVTLLRKLTSIEEFHEFSTQSTVFIGTMGLTGMIVFTVIGQKRK